MALPTGMFPEVALSCVDAVRLCSLSLLAQEEIGPLSAFVKKQKRDMYTGMRAINKL